MPEASEEESAIAMTSDEGADPGPGATRRVLFLAGTLAVGGAELQLLYMLRVLRAGGHEIEVVTLEAGVFVERIEALGIPVTVLGPARTPIHRLLQVIGHVRRVRPDVIQAAHNWVSAYTAAAGRLLRTPSIGANRSGPGETLATVGPIGHLSFRLPPVIAVNSARSLEELVEVGVDRSRLVHLPNAVDTERFEPVDRRAGDGPDRPFTLLGIGRFTERKRFDLFLEVVAEVMSARADVETILIGDGPDRDGLEAKAQDLAMDERLTWVQTDDPLGFYRRADLLVFTSGPGEGMPNVVLEAMATGLPVVAFESGDVAQVVIDGQTGRLIEPWGDTTAMVTTVLSLIDDERARTALSDRAEELVASDYSLAALARNLDRLHLRAMSGRSRVRM